MRHLIDLLFYPLEDDIVRDNNTDAEAAPDRYRRFLFNNPRMIIDKTPETYQYNMEMSHIDEETWKTTDERTLKDNIRKYRELKRHYLTDYLVDGEPLPTTIESYYRTIYDICDIIIVKSLHDGGDSLLIAPIKEALELAKPDTHIAYRVVYYLTYYLFRVLSHNVNRKCREYSRVCLEKMRSFRDEVEISRYFTKDEVEDYISFLEKEANK